MKQEKSKAESFVHGIIAVMGFFIYFVPMMLFGAVLVAFAVYMSWAGIKALFF